MIMKKFLLIAVAALAFSSANAQIAKKQFVGKPIAKKQVEQKATPMKYQIAGAKLGVKPVMDKSSKTFKMTAKELKSIKPVAKQFKSARAGEVQPKYNGTGTLRSENTTTNWDMVSGTGTKGDGTAITLLQNVIPDIFGFDGGVVVEYSLVNGNIVIQPQLIASFPDENAPTGTYYLFLESATSNDGAITLTLDNDGNITGTYSIIYSVYPAENYNFADWVGTYDGVQGAQYTVPGRDIAPIVSFEPSSLVLFAGLGLNGYSFNNNLAITGAYTNTTFANRTTNPASAWNWTAYDASTEPKSILAEGTDKNFSLYLDGGQTANNVTLIGKKGEKVSEPFTFGIGKSQTNEGAARYTDSYLYAGSGESSFTLNNETPAIITRQDPDGDLTFYTNWGTPDKTDTEMTKIFAYHEKPATPLYITGVSLPMVNFTAQDNFNLHIKIVKASYPENATKPTLGDVIAEGDATSENINAAFNSGLTAVEIPLYTEDESGLSNELEHLFIDSEFVIIIEGWNNGSFSGVLGCQDAPLDNARTSTWFEKAGEAGKMYSYTTWKTSLFIGLMGATYGYLHTEDNTNVTIPAEGGEAKINVEPMLIYNDNAGQPTTGIWLDENIEGNEIPEWLEVGTIDHYSVDNEGYLDEANFDLVFTASALPTGVEGRKASLVFMQPGAQLFVTVAQGAASGVEVTTKTVKTADTPAFNMAGQRVNKDFKGLVVKDGKKFMNK